MKNSAVILIVLAGVVLAGPVLDPEPVVDVVLKKLDDQTLEVKTTTTSISTVLHDKAELQTELDHIPDRISTLQEQIASLNERAVEIENMLKVLE